MMKIKLGNKHRHFKPHPYRRTFIWQMGQPIKNKANLPMLSSGLYGPGTLAALGDAKGGDEL